MVCMVSISIYVHTYGENINIVCMYGVWVCMVYECMVYECIWCIYQFSINVCIVRCMVYHSIHVCMPLYVCMYGV